MKINNIREGFFDTIGDKAGGVADQLTPGRKAKQSQINRQAQRQLYQLWKNRYEVQGVLLTPANLLNFLSNRGLPIYYKQLKAANPKIPNITPEDIADIIKNAWNYNPTDKFNDQDVRNLFTSVVKELTRTITNKRLTTQMSIGKKEAPKKEAPKKEPITTPKDVDKNADIDYNAILLQIAQNPKLVKKLDPNAIQAFIQATVKG